MQSLNAAIAWIVDLVLRPMASWPAAASLAVISLIVSAGLLAAVRLTSNQPALAGAKRAVAAGLLELRLFQDDPRLVFRVLGDLLIAQGRYLRYALVPMAWVAVPLALLLAHLDAWYGREALRAGATAVVTVRLRADAAATSDRVRQMLTLEAPAGLQVETPPVWAPALHEAAWRIRADRNGDYQLQVGWDGTRVTRRIQVSPHLVAAQALRPAARIWDVWLNPSEAPLPADVPFDAIGVGYPHRDVSVFGLSVPWLVLFLLLTMLFTVLGRPIFRVTI